MREERYLVVALFSTLFVREAWTLFPYNEVTRDYFPYYDIKMTFQTYIFFPCQISANAITMYVLSRLFDSTRVIFSIWFWLTIIEFFDYFFTYNVPWTTLDIFGLQVDFGITILKMVVLFTVILIKFITWKQ